MDTKLFELDNLRCEYLFDSRSCKHVYHFSWDRIEDDSIQWICIFLLDGDNQPRDNLFCQALRCPEGVSIDAPMVTGEQIFVVNFAVVAGRGDQETWAIKRMVPDLHWQRISCKAVYASGRIRWRLDKCKERGQFILLLESSLRLWEGIIYYSYVLGETTIRIPVPGTIEKGKNKFAAFYYPAQAREFKIVSDAANMAIDVLPSWDLWKLFR